MSANEEKGGAPRQSPDPAEAICQHNPVDEEAHARDPERWWIGSICKECFDAFVRRSPCTGSGWQAVDRQGTYWSTITPLDGECGICHQRVRIDSDGRCVTHPPAPAAPVPSSSTPPAPDLPQEKEDQEVPSARSPMTDAREALRNALARAEAAEKRLEEARRFVWDGRGYTAPASAVRLICAEHGWDGSSVGVACSYCLRAAAQRPPDPAAPDLRGLLREARDFISVSPGADPRPLLARIDAALDDSGKVGEET